MFVKLWNSKSEPMMNYSNTTAWASSAQWYIHVPSYSVAQPRAIGMDILWFCLPSTHPKCKQGEKTTLGSTASRWSFWECHIQWWSLDPTWNTLEKVLQEGEKPQNKPRPKHPPKVHVWAGISTRGATNICIFTGTMDSEFYVWEFSTRAFCLP